MTFSDPKRVLWENVAALMRHHWGRENLLRLAREAKIGPGSATRIKEMQTSVGLDTVERLAACFSLEPWQLLIPHLAPADPPATWLTESQATAYKTLRAAAQAIRA